MKAYFSHWSDNRNRLGEPTASGSSTKNLHLPFVHFTASSMKQAKAKVRDFNSLPDLGPETEGPQPAHIPLELLAANGFHPAESEVPYV